MWIKNHVSIVIVICGLIRRTVLTFEGDLIDGALWFTYMMRKEVRRLRFKFSFCNIAWASTRDVSEQQMAFVVRLHHMENVPRVCAHKLCRFLAYMIT